MRLMQIIILILIAVIGSGFWLNHELQMSTNDLIEQIDRINQQIRDENWPKAVKETDKLEEVWQRKAKWWPIFLEHQEIDNIEFSMARFKEYVANKNNSLALGQLSEIRLMIEHIPEKEKVNFENIL